MCHLKVNVSLTVFNRSSDVVSLYSVRRCETLSSYVCFTVVSCCPDLMFMCALMIALHINRDTMSLQFNMCTDYMVYF